MADDRTDAGGPDVADAPKRFPPGYVGNVYFDGGNAHGLDGIKQRDAGVSVGAGIDDDAVGIAIGLLDAVDQGALVVALEKIDRNAPCLGVRGDFLQEVAVGLAAVDPRLADPKHIQVRPVKH